jgi:hypothetical protein
MPALQSLRGSDSSGSDDSSSDDDGEGFKNYLQSLKSHPLASAPTAGGMETADASAGDEDETVRRAFALMMQDESEESVAAAANGDSAAGTRGGETMESAVSLHLAKLQQVSVSASTAFAQLGDSAESDTGVQCEPCSNDGSTVRTGRGCACCRPEWHLSPEDLAKLREREREQQEQEQEKQGARGAQTEGAASTAVPQQTGRNKWAAFPF